MLAVLLVCSSALLLVQGDAGAGRTWTTEDAVIVEAATLPRTSRELKESIGSSENALEVPAPVGGRGGRQAWPGVFLPGTGPCYSTQGRLGQCTSFRACYPFFKVPDYPTWENWVLGVFDTCSYFGDSGRQLFGVCCTEQQGAGGRPPVAAAPPAVPIAPAEPQPNPSPVMPVPIMPNPIPPNWPPPIPTHPPEHQTHPPLPTHPPAPGLPGFPTSPPMTSTTKKPPTAAPPSLPNWPPPIPTHPTQRPTLSPWPPTTKPPSIAPIAPSPTPTPAPELNDAACGAKNGFQDEDQERIVGGQNADIGEWPWIAALFNGGRQFCGGSLIDSTHILTAAHCVAHMSSWDVARLTVRLGDHNIKSNSETRHIEKKVRRVVRHRGFDSRTLYNDVAILTMDSPVAYRREIRPICLPSGNAAYSGKVATVIGWGSLRESGPQPAVLQEVSIPVWSNLECRQKYGNAAPGGIIDTFLCAGQASRDSCSGDSGGPLMVNDGRWTQVGVVSWGIGCGKGQYPGVYTRVTSFMPWITKNLK